MNSSFGCTELNLAISKNVKRKRKLLAERNLQNILQSLCEGEVLRNIIVILSHTFEFHLNWNYNVNDLYEMFFLQYAD